MYNLHSPASGHIAAAGTGQLSTCLPRRLAMLGRLFLAAVTCLAHRAGFRGMDEATYKALIADIEAGASLYAVQP